MYTLTFHHAKFQVNRTILNFQPPTLPRRPTPLVGDVEISIFEILVPHLVGMQIFVGIRVFPDVIGPFLSIFGGLGSSPSPAPYTFVTSSFMISYER